MEYCESYLEHFCTIAEADDLPLSARVVYIHLLNINRRLHWREWFSVANSTLLEVTGLGSNNSIVSAKNRLKQANLIDFKSEGKKTTRYTLIAQDTAQDTAQPTAQDTAQDGAQDTAQRGAQLKRYINKQMCKGEKKQSKKFTPPTFEEVKAYCEEKHLTISPQRFIDYYEAGDWTDKAGKPVKNWKQRLQTWQAHEPEKKPTPSQFEYPIQQGDETFGTGAAL